MPARLRRSDGSKGFVRGRAGKKPALGFFVDFALRIATLAPVKSYQLLAGQMMMAMMMRSMRGQAMS